MNPLALHIAKHRLKPSAVMDALQAAGVISDNAVYPHDVAEEDAGRAVVWVENDQSQPAGRLEKL